MLKTKFLKKTLTNPTVLASGVMGTSGESLCEAARHGAGAVTIKSFTLKERPGHKNPTMAELPYGFLNAIGLSGSGLEALKELEYAVENSGVPVIASIFGANVEEYAKMASIVNKCKSKPAFIEANISCPNVGSEFGSPFACDPKISAKITAAIKEKTKIPLSIKLTPTVASIVEVGKAVEKAGADAITAINCAGPGMVIDIDTHKPVLANYFGGMSGPVIKPIAVRCVYQLYENVGIPIIGLGGIENADDAIEMIMAGATLVGIGSAVRRHGLSVFSKVTKGMAAWMKENGFKNLEDLRGKAHE
jgi:dihydroorotate dehydrogenase (NAD+) catalytic subunit